MSRIHRVLTTAALIGCLSAQWSGTLLAHEVDASSSESIGASTTDAGTQPQQSSREMIGGLVIGEETARAMNLPSAAPFALKGSQPLGAVSLAQRGWYRGRGRRHGAAQAEMVLGAVAAIAGAAVLTYANRPECSANHAADGCGYGTKVVGTSVAAGGLVALLAGALTWR